MKKQDKPADVFQELIELANVPNPFQALNNQEVAILLKRPQAAYVHGTLTEVSGTSITVQNPTCSYGDTAGMTRSMDLGYAIILLDNIAVIGPKKQPKA